MSKIFTSGFFRYGPRGRIDEVRLSALCGETRVDYRVDAGETAVTVRRGRDEAYHGALEEIGTVVPAGVAGPLAAAIRSILYDHVEGGRLRQELVNRSWLQMYAQGLASAPWRLVREWGATRYLNAVVADTGELALDLYRAGPFGHTMRPWWALADGEEVRFDRDPFAVDAPAAISVEPLRSPLFLLVCRQTPAGEEWTAIRPSDMPAAALDWLLEREAARKGARYAGAVESDVFDFYEEVEALGAATPEAIARAVEKFGAP